MCSCIFSRRLSDFDKTSIRKTLRVGQKTITTIMKKVYMMLAVCAIALASCKKDYTCSCTVLGQTADTVIPDAKKADAEEACDASSAAAALLGGSCELK
jgi:hypothetical protein